MIPTFLDFLPNDRCISSGESIYPCDVPNSLALTNALVARVGWAMISFPLVWHEELL